jgi:hypothetical protein
LVSSGVPADLAAAEINQAISSPYLQGAERLRNRLAKRDWVLGCYRKLHRLLPKSGRVERRSGLTQGEFLEQYYAANRPVVLTGMMDDWPAIRRWSLESLAERFCKRDVEVQYGRSSDDQYEVEKDRHRRVLPFGEFLADVASAGWTNDFYMTAGNDSRNKLAIPEMWDDIGPMSELLDSSGPRAGYLWIGPAGTITPFHHDLTNNLVAQVVGRKRVKIVPSWDLPLMGNHRHVFSEVDGRALPPASVPGAYDPQVLECVIGPGEALFLPIGCLHYVEALDVSISVSFTNFVFDNDFCSFYTTYDEV